MTHKIMRRQAQDDDELKAAAKRAMVVIHGGSADRLVGPGTDLILLRKAGLTLPKVDCPIVDTTTIPDDDQHDEQMLTILRNQVDNALDLDVTRLIQSLKAIGATVSG